MTPASSLLPGDVIDVEIVDVDATGQFGYHVDLIVLRIEVTPLHAEVFFVRGSRAASRIYSPSTTPVLRRPPGLLAHQRGGLTDDVANDVLGQTAASLAALHAGREERTDDIVASLRHGLDDPEPLEGEMAYGSDEVRIQVAIVESQADDEPAFNSVPCCGALLGHLHLPGCDSA